ncbi:SDR family oxidoreductase [Streptomyces sp. NPDC005574]|uniref:SDR family oxidoreductase n=1 Tax=Streptomyces sp. NPDC005574 TaxID=3156891 RepID=UPI0033A25037
MEHHLVTGATGLLGSAIVLELLERTNGKVTCLVRPRPGLDADTRLKSELQRAATVYGRPDLAPEIEGRCHGLIGDITEPSCGAGLTGNADHFWHVAASMAYEYERKEDIVARNIDGTRNALALGRAARCATFNFISSALVAGRRNGWIAADPADPSAAVNNWYEYSKVASECEVRAQSFDSIRIFRPSLIIGHSRTLAATTISGLYNLALGLALAVRELRGRGGEPPWPLRINGLPDGSTNYIPVDAAARAAVQITLADTGTGVYHLTNAHSTPLRDTFRALSRILEIPEAVIQDGAEGFTDADHFVNDKVGVYRPYLRCAKEFDQTNVAQLIGPVDLPIDTTALATHLAWYLHGPGGDILASLGSQPATGLGRRVAE